MAAHVDGEVVKCPGTLVVSTYPLFFFFFVLFCFFVFFVIVFDA